MSSSVFRRWIIRGLVGVVTALVCIPVLALVERKRTESELNEVLSAYLSEGILNDAHDWGSGRGIVVALQSEAQEPGNWRARWLYPFDKRLRFSGSSFVTRVSFTLSNGFHSRLALALHLPKGMSAVELGRRNLESGEFQIRFPNSFGYIAISRAGLNFNKTEAIFYIDHFCGLCGGGRYVLMRKMNGSWKLVEEHYTWVS